MKNRPVGHFGLRAIAVALIAAVSCTAPPPTPTPTPPPILNLYNWKDYLGPTTLADFEAETGVKVNLATFDSEEEMLGTVQSDPARYDLIVVSGFVVRQMTKLKLLAPLEKGALANWEKVAPGFLDPPYDPGNTYCAPYLWGTTGIAINIKHVSTEEKGWGILWNPKYQGKVAMLNDPQVIIGAALKYLGYSLNEAAPAALSQAEAKLTAQKPLLAGYLDTITIRDQMISGELWAAQIYSGDALYAAERNPEVAYFIPREGAETWVDSFCLPRDAPHRAQAEAFIDFVLRPEVNAAIVNHLWYATANAAARQFVNPAILEDPNVYPAAEVASRLELWRDIKERADLDNRIWAKLQR